MKDINFNKPIEHNDVLRITRQISKDSKKLFTQLEELTDYCCNERIKLDSNSKTFKKIDTIIDALVAFQFNYYLLLKKNGFSVKVVESDEEKTSQKTPSIIKAYQVSKSIIKH